MSDRRMISQKVIGSDVFLALPVRAQALYVQLMFQADDDGFVTGGKKVCRSLRAPQSTLDILVRGGYLLAFEGGVYLIRHWRVANSLRSAYGKLPAFERFASRVYVEENQSYSLEPNENRPTLLELKQMQHIQRSQCAAVEEKGKEEKRKDEIREEEIRTEKNSSPSVLPLSQAGFTALWEAYPVSRRGNRGEGERVFCSQIVGQTSLSLALDNLQRWKASQQWRRENGRFIPSFVNFLSREQWRVAPEPEGEIPSCTLGRAELEAIQNVLREEV